MRARKQSLADVYGGSKFLRLWWYFRDAGVTDKQLGPIYSDERAKAFSNLSWFLGEQSMALIIADANREQQEDFVWCVPVPRVSWQKWYELSKQFKGVTPQDVRYMHRIEEKRVKTIIMLPTKYQSDDDVLTAAAWLRMVKQWSCRIYVCRCSDDSFNQAQRILQAAGSDGNLMDEVDDGNPTGEASDKAASTGE